MIDFTQFKSVISVISHFNNEDYVQRYIDEQAYRWNTRKMNASYRFEDMFKKAVKHFEYADVLGLSSVVDVVAWKAKHDSYYWAGKVA